MSWLIILHHDFRAQGTPSDQDSKTQRWLSMILYDKEKQEILTLINWKYIIVQYFY